MWFLTGRRDQRIGLFIRIHHVVADGIAGVAEFGVLLDAAPSTARTSGRPWTPEPEPSARHLLHGNLQRRLATLESGLKNVSHPVAMLRRARAAMPAMRELLTEEPGPDTSLNRVIGQDRTLALMRSSLELVNEAAHMHGPK
jgi:diacylglycerol O-acyltransferase